MRSVTACPSSPPAGCSTVAASLLRFEGQLSTFKAYDGKTACYRCLFPEPPPPGTVPSCAEGGVFGVLPGVIGSIQAAEAIKRGDVTTVIAGATENPLIEVAHIGFMNMRGLGSPRAGEGEGSACRPYDVDRNGFVLGEGAGAFIVEDLESAKARGARMFPAAITSPSWSTMHCRA